MWERIKERKPIQNGLRRAGVHMAKAAYEIVGGIGAFADEIVGVIRDDADDDTGRTGPTKITVD
jgi:hypothetical protein